MNRRWICSDVWMDILPSFDRPQLGLKMALLSDRFDVLVDAHFDGKSELTIWSEIRIRKDKGPKAKLSVWIDDKFVDFPLPDHPLPNKIRFRFLQIDYIDHSVIEFLRSNKQIWDRSGTNLELDVRSYEMDVQQIATAGQALTKWLHTPSKDGQPKRLNCNDYSGPLNLEWVNNFKETFRRATTSVSYHIQLYFHMEPTPIEPFELLNERTNEKLALKHNEEYNLVNWLLQRCPIGETATAPIKFDLRYGINSGANFNKIIFYLWGESLCIGPLSPPAVEEEELD